MTSFRSIARIGYAAVLMLTFARTGFAEHRVALLIGNASYGEHSLRTPHSDVRAVAGALERRGFRTTVRTDLDGNQFAETLERFVSSAPTRGTALVYFAGYAVSGERDGTLANLLLPVDTRSGGSGRHARSVRDILDLLYKRSGASIKMVLVDGAYSRTGFSGGLTDISEIARGSVVGFAAPPRRVVKKRQKLSAMASKLVEQLNDSVELVEAIRVASGWSRKNLEDGLQVVGRGSWGISSDDAFGLRHAPGTEWVNDHGMVFCWCPAGDTARGFWLGKFELTLREWGPHVSKSLATDNNHPIDLLHPDVLRVHLARLTESEIAAGRLPAGWEYALPTDTEWEYACRAGTNTPFYFGDDRRTLALHANFADKALLGWGYTEHTLNDGTRRLARVGNYLANPWGLHDMYGNLWEFVESGTDDWVVRGGSWVSLATLCVSSSRHVLEDQRPRNFVGYRVIIREGVSVSDGTGR